MRSAADIGALPLRGRPRRRISVTPAPLPSGCATSRRHGHLRRQRKATFLAATGAGIRRLPTLARAKLVAVLRAVPTTMIVRGFGGYRHARASAISVTENCRELAVAGGVGLRSSRFDGTRLLSRRVAASPRRFYSAASLYDAVEACFVSLSSTHRSRSSAEYKTVLPLSR